MDKVGVAAPSQGSTCTTPTTVSRLCWETGGLGPSPHCVSLGSPLAFSGPQFVHL